MNEVIRASSFEESRPPQDTRNVEPRNILLVFPRFNENSFWALADTCRVHGARAPAPPLGLMTVAAMLPQDWNMKLVNRNTEELTDADLEWADIVMTGGMLPQSVDTGRLIEICKDKGVTVCVGGPDITSRPDVYKAADIRVLGELEGIIEEFVAALRRGVRTGVFESPKFQADVTKAPIPRYDLIKFHDYMWINLQFSRGCPFNCEFCDIIELYGRVPRTKTIEQVLSELDRLLALGYRGHVDFVDDNLIGNKKALKKLLPELKKWQEKHFYPFMFSTEASLNLADDEELLHMLRDCGFFTVFIGIESSDTETLVSMQKKQNTRRSIADSLHRIYDAGIFAIAGFILGFDTEKDGVAPQMIATIKETSIPICIVGLLVALPNTQLNRRLKKEGRLIADLSDSIDLGDQCTAGLNFATIRPQREIMRDYAFVLREVFDRDAFFARVTHLADSLKRPALPGKFNLKQTIRDLGIVGRFLKEITLRRPDLFAPVMRLAIHCLRTNPRALQAAISNVLMFLHVSKFTQFVVAETERRIISVDAGTVPAASAIEAAGKVAA